MIAIVTGTGSGQFLYTFKCLTIPFLYLVYAKVHDLPSKLKSFTILSFPPFYSLVWGLLRLTPITQICNMYKFLLTSFFHYFESIPGSTRLVVYAALYI